MSYRLYPDIIIAAKIVDSYKRTYYLFSDKVNTNDIYISIESCLTMQGCCKNMGVENIFTNSGCGIDSDRDWEEKDYLNFIKRFPQYFTKVNKPYYKVNLQNLLENINFTKKPVLTNDIINALKSKLLEHSYSDRMLQYLGL